MQTPCGYFPLKLNPISLDPFLHHSYIYLAHLGGLGVLALAALDSSLLFLPFGIDLLVVAMSVRAHALVPYYALMASAGSVIGCESLDLLIRKGSEKELERLWPKRRVEYVMRRVRKNAIWTLAVVSLVPPPFPFTPFVAAAAAAKVPRQKFLGVIGTARFVRFIAEGALATVFGKELLRMAGAPEFQYAIVLLIVISLVGSGFSVHHWIVGSRRAGPQRPKRAKNAGH
jgi:membrane protein YqaA with SNARE-associated domain